MRVLEARSVIGGAALTEEFHPGFRNSVYSYSISLLHPRIISDLHLEEHGLEIMEPMKLEAELNGIVGVVTNGLFAHRPADVLILGIDTATRQLGLALHRDTGLVAELLIAEGLRHCERLLYQTLRGPTIRWSRLEIQPDLPRVGK